jgi:trehalose/maltose hydrolase-like predicted phosphorylase
MSAPINPHPVTGIDGDGLPAYLSNGVIGLRVRLDPLQRGVAVVNGLSATHPHALVECSPHAPYPLGGDVQIGGTWLSDVPHCVDVLEQTYDFSAGELHTRMRASVRDVRADINVLTFCSRSQPTIAVQEVTVEFDRACETALRAVLDPSEIPGRWSKRWHEVPIDEGELIDGALEWDMLGGLSACGVAYTTEFLGSVDPQIERPERRTQGPLCTTYGFTSIRGRTYRLRQLSAVVPSTSHHQPDLQAARVVALAKKIGFDELRVQNRQNWDDLWMSRVKLHGAESRWQAMADAAFFYLHSSTHRASHASTSIFGLAQWHDYHYYYGHVMWDIETFSLPPLMLTQPDAARALLEFRYRTLGAARANARVWGYRGAQYPWEAGPHWGEEAAPGAGDAASFEHHVSMAVACAFSQFADLSGDAEFRRHRSWPVMVGVADWIMSRVTKTPRGYEIRRAMGIAEREEPSDNVAYVNMAAAVALRSALRCSKQLGYEPTGPWQEIADNLVIPVDGNVVLDHDGFSPDEEKGATPAVLAGFFPYGYRVDEAVERATIEFYLERADEYIGSPMLSSLYGVWATRLGDRERAADLLEEGYAKFVNERFMNVHEYRHDRFPEQPIAGPFFANLSGFLLGCLFGYPRLQVDHEAPENWCRGAVVLPAGWDAIEVDRIFVRNRPARLIAEHGARRARLEFLA